jgi:hypothetical protein
MSVTGIEIQEFETLEVLAAAIAIFEYNNGYFKTNEFINNGEDIYSTKYANKEILRSQFMVDYYNSTQKPPLVKVREEHFNKAKVIREYSKKEIFNLIANQDSYNTKIYEIVNKEYIQSKDFGFIASAPFYYQINKSKDHYKQSIANIQSQHVGSLGGKVYLEDFEIIRNNKSNNYPGWVVQGICEGNLFLFFTRHDIWADRKPGDKINLEGTVKDHVIEQNTIPMTKLNRVHERTQNGIRADSNSNMFGQRKVADSGLDFLFPDTTISSQS